MKVIRERAVESFLGVYLTAVSMVEAIALENLVSQASELSSQGFFAGLGMTVTLQCLFMFSTILAMWVLYVTFSTVARWVLGPADLLGPFAMGAVQLIAITVISDEISSEFLIMVAIGFIAAVVVNWSTVAAASQDAEAQDAIRGYPRMPIRVLMGGTSAVCLIALIGISSPILVKAMLIFATLQCFTMISVQVRWWLRATGVQAAA